MKMHQLKRIVALFCIILIVLYASAVFLPHDHNGCESECVACVAIETIEKLFLFFAACALLTGILPIDRVFLVAGICGNSILKNTPVKLRDKLSN